MSGEQSLLFELDAIDEEARRGAVESRDARFDGMFVYGVRTTLVYCKPSCPSRRARSENVEFFASCEEAESAGFRACRRCRPRSLDEPDARLELVERACRLIESQTEGSPSLSSLGEELGVSPFHLQRVFKSVTGVTPRQYAAGRRVAQFKNRIKEGDAVIDAMYEAGYGSSSRLYESASSELGMTPASYARGGAGRRIGYAIVACELGRLLVAATERGLCAVRLGDTDAELEETLSVEFAAAEIGRDDAGMGEWVEAVLRHIEGQQSSLDGRRPSIELPLDVRATVFQRRVWEELRRIPYGATRSYSEIARAIGQPTATRAVARACATNPVAILTPCHRVVREDGSPGGYRWGIERKRRLLAKEREGADSTRPVE